MRCLDRSIGGLNTKQGVRNMAQQNTRDQERSTTSSSNAQSGQGGTAAKRSMAPASAMGDKETTGDRANINGVSDKNLIEQVKNTAAGAYGTATSKATEKLEEQKSSLTTTLTSVAENIRKLGQNLGEESSESGLTSSA